MKLGFLIGGLVCCFLLSGISEQAAFSNGPEPEIDDVVTRKTPTILANLLISQDPIRYAKAHDIALKNGMVKVVISVGKGAFPEGLAARYDLKNYSVRGQRLISYVGVASLKELIKDPAVISIRLPTKLKGMPGSTSRAN